MIVVVVMVMIMIVVMVLMVVVIVMATMLMVKIDDGSAGDDDIFSEDEYEQQSGPDRNSLHSTYFPFFQEIFCS